jgi:hypothetical protein
MKLAAPHLDHLDGGCIGRAARHVARQGRPKPTREVVATDSNFHSCGKLGALIGPHHAI